MTRRRLASALLLVAVLLAPISVTGCAGNAVDDPQAKAVQLARMDKLANGATVVLTIMRQLQDSEIAAYNTHTIAGLTDAKHTQIQTAAKKFFADAEAQLTVAKSVATADATRRDSILALITGANTFLTSFDSLKDSSLLAAIIASATAAVLSLNLAV